MDRVRAGGVVIVVAGINHFVPERVVTNDEIIEARALKMKASWIEKKLGIKERRWTDAPASDLAVAAARGLKLEDFKGAIFVSTVSPDHLTPSTASIVKQKLGLKDHMPAVDVSAACAGLLFAMEQAAFRLRATGEKEALVIATEVRSRFLNRDDRRTVFLFGDGAVALHLKNEDGPHGIEWTRTFTVASDNADILVPAGGSAMPLTPEVLASGAQFITMNDGPKIVELTTQVLVDEVQRVLTERKVPLTDVQHLFLHQGNASICSAIAERLGLPVERTFSNFDRLGNTSSASVGICLSEAAPRIKAGDRVLLVAMGAGYHYGIVSLRWAL